jgi:hypothetical protein
MSKELIKLYKSVDMTLKMNLQGISHADSITHIDNCNCINWIVGHIVVSRNGILALMNLPPVASDKLKAVYERGSKMMTDTATAENLETLVKLFDETQQRILEGVTKAYSDEVIDRLTFLGFHEGYHVGQVATMRKILGKEGAIK